MSAINTVIKNLTDRPENIQQRYTAAKVIRELYKRYGKGAKTQLFIDEIEKVEPTISQLLIVLKEHHLLSEKALDELVSQTRTIRKKQEDVTHIYVAKDSASKELTHKLEKHFSNTKSKTLKNEDLGLIIQKQEKLYKRMLDTDIKQLLK